MAEMAKRIANGTRARDIPAGRATYTTMLDWRELQRWNIPESRVPAGSVVLFRGRSFFGLYRSYVVAGLVVFTIQLALIVGLLAQRNRRRSAEQVAAANDAALRASYDRNRDLVGRLITAQEAERSRIARDLHDGVCQELASASVDVSYLRQKGGHIQAPDAQQTLVSLQSRMAGAAETLRLLSHGLHPSVLQHIGLVAALQSQCAEVERQYHVQVTFFADDEVEPTSWPTALALFRIAQEALRNTARHAHARHAAVSLARSDGHLTLTVADDGEGFDALSVRQNGGLGLASIEERARLVQGHATIRSQPGKGTTVDVRILLDVRDDSRGLEFEEQAAVMRAMADLPRDPN
jgi:signal transduction histidine kinase